jgi:putative SOS response-associated peptidase YedK
MLRPLDASAMTADPVSNWVNSPQHNDPRCIAVVS